jgi:hypothetical protein
MEEPRQAEQEAKRFFDELNSKIVEIYFNTLVLPGSIDNGFVQVRREQLANTLFFNLINGIEDEVKRALVSSTVWYSGMGRGIDPDKEWAELVDYDEEGEIFRFSVPHFGRRNSNPWEINCKLITCWFDCMELGDPSLERVVEPASSRFCDYCSGFVTLEQIQDGNWFYSGEEPGYGTRGLVISHKH